MFQANSNPVGPPARGAVPQHSGSPHATPMQQNVGGATAAAAGAPQTATAHSQFLQTHNSAPTTIHRQARHMHRHGNDDFSTTRALSAPYQFSQPTASAAAAPPPSPPLGPLPPLPPPLTSSASSSLPPPVPAATNNAPNRITGARRNRHATTSAPMRRRVGTGGGAHRSALGGHHRSALSDSGSLKRMRLRGIGGANDDFLPSEDVIKFRRKTRKNDREKQRRCELNTKFDALSDLLHLSRRKVKTEKAVILQAAIREITALRAENLELRLGSSLHGDDDEEEADAASVGDEDFDIGDESPVVADLSHPNGPMALQHGLAQQRQQQQQQGGVMQYDMHHQQQQQHMQMQQQQMQTMNSPPPPQTPFQRGMSVPNSPPPTYESSPDMAAARGAALPQPRSRAASAVRSAPHSQHGANYGFSLDGTSAACASTTMGELPPVIDIQAQVRQEQQQKLQQQQQHQAEAHATGNHGPTRPLPQPRLRSTAGAGAAPPPQFSSPQATSTHQRSVSAGYQQTSNECNPIFGSGALSPLTASALKSPQASPILPNPYDTTAAERATVQSTSSAASCTPLLPATHSATFPLTPVSPMQQAKFTPGVVKCEAIKMEPSAASSSNYRAQSHSRGSSLESELSSSCSEASSTQLDENPESFGSNASTMSGPMVMAEQVTHPHPLRMSTPTPSPVDLDTTQTPIPMRAGEGGGARLSFSMSLDDDTPTSFATSHMNLSATAPLLSTSSCRSEIFNPMPFGGEHGGTVDSDMMTDDFSNRAIF